MPRGCPVPPEVPCRRVRPGTGSGGCDRARWKDRRRRQRCRAYFESPPEALAPTRSYGSSCEPMGWILEPLRVQGYAIIRLTAEERELVEGLFKHSHDFFGRPESYKENFKFYPFPGGYLTPNPGSYEVFELRRGLFRCPEELAGQAMGAFRLLERLALQVTAEIGRDVGVDMAAMPDDTSPAMRCIHYDRPAKHRGPADFPGEPPFPPPANTEVRTVGLQGADAILNGMRGKVRSADAEGASVAFDELPAAVLDARGGARELRVPLANLRLMRSNAPGIYPAHTDSSLVTVAPRSVAAGLEAKDLNTGEWFMIEERLKADECLVFVGDPIDYVSLHRYRALMHRAAISHKGTNENGIPLVGLRKAAQTGAQHRVSTPFFLYPRNSAVLAPPGLPRITFDDLNGNINKCRDVFPWKLQSCYYTDLIYSDNDDDLAAIGAK